jgi:hypothetical protein
MEGDARIVLPLATLVGKLLVWRVTLATHMFERRLEGSGRFAEEREVGTLKFFAGQV